MSKQPKKKPTGTSTIAKNRKARHDFNIEQHFEAGLILQGWEVKSLRDGHLQLKGSYVLLKDGEAWLIGAHITPLANVSTHLIPDPTRTRKLLLNAKELGKLFNATEREGYTIVPLSMYWKRGRAKLDIAIAKGKKTYDKRETEKRRDWEREKQQILKNR